MSKFFRTITSKTFDWACKRSSQQQYNMRQKQTGYFLIRVFTKCPYTDLFYRTKKIKDIDREGHIFI